MECAPDAPRENEVSQEGQLLDEIARVIRLKNRCKTNLLEKVSEGQMARGGKGAPRRGWLQAASES